MTTTATVPVWVPAEAADFAVGDRLRCHNDYEPTNIIEGTVRVAGRGALEMQRDDGHGGGGCRYEGRHLWSVTNESGQLFKLAHMPEGWEPPLRAVHCIVCAMPTGEITNKVPTSKFCKQCRDLPALYDYHGETEGGFINTDNGLARTMRDPERVAERLRIMGAGGTADPGWPAVAVPVTTIDYVDFDEEDEEDPLVAEPTDRLVCQCGGDEFALENLQWEELPDPETPTVYTGDLDDYTDGDTIYFEYPYQPEPDIDQYRARVCCTACGTEYHGGWEWS